MNKPDPQKLEEETNQIIADLDKPEEEIPEDTPAEETPSKPPVDEPEDKPEEEIPEDTPAEETQEEKDYKKKFADSTREAMALASKNKKLNEAVDSAGSIPDPTEEDLKKEYTDWDLMSETEKKLATKAYIADKRFEVIHQAAQEGKDVAAWHDKVDEFSTNPKTLNHHPELEGKTDEFRLFAEKESRRGADLDDLVNSFLFEVEKTRPNNKGKKMFETGSGGPNEKPIAKSTKLSVEDSEKLRQTDYGKYRQELQAGNIAELE